MVASELDAEYSIGVVHVWPYHLVSYLVGNATLGLVRAGTVPYLGECVPPVSMPRRH